MCDAYVHMTIYMYLLGMTLCYHNILRLFPRILYDICFKLRVHMYMYYSFLSKLS
jgi:hypothetical protein